MFLRQQSRSNCPGTTPATHYLHEPVQTARNQQKTQANKLKKRTPKASKLAPNLNLPHQIQEMATHPDTVLEPYNLVQQPKKLKKLDMLSHWQHEKKTDVSIYRCRGLSPFQKRNEKKRRIYSCTGSMGTCCPKPVQNGKNTLSQKMKKRKEHNTQRI
jgi:hypothetical protein